MKTSKILESKFKRRFIWGWRQKGKNQICPNTPLLNDKVIVITGENGAYHHNTQGKAILPKNDIALNVEKAKDFWTTLEKIYSDYLK